MLNIADKVKELESKVVLYEAVLALLDVGVHVIDLEQNTLVYNKAMGRIEDEDPGRMVGQPFMAENSFFRDRDSTLLRVLKTGEAVSDSTQTYWNSRGKSVITVNKTQPLVINGKLAGAVETARDVTHIQLLAEKIMDLHESSAKRKKKTRQSKAACPGVRYTFESIIGKSADIAQAISHAQKIAQTSSNVLIYGETGTGKELFAQSIHAASERRGNPFIDVNCAALPSQLLEGILFGSVKGGFTDAQDRPGLFEQADGGTLLLDEINSMQVGLQGKLLRVLQEKRIRRLGATVSTPIDVRIIATINNVPARAIEEKELREDLYYRLSVANLNLVPLRNRLEDIPEYVDFFIKKYASRLGLKVTGCSPKVTSLFQHHQWPGNVRQLEHVIEGALNLVNKNDRLIMLEHLPMLFTSGENGVDGDGLLIRNSGMGEHEAPRAPARHSRPPAGGMKLQVEKEQMELGLIRQALEENAGNISQTARGLGITRQLLQYKMKKYGLNKKTPVAG